MHARDVSVCEEVCDEPNIFDDEKTLVANVPNMAEAVDIASRPEDVAVLEERVKEWIKRVQEVGGRWASAAWLGSVKRGSIVNLKNHSLVGIRRNPLSFSLNLLLFRQQVLMESEQLRRENDSSGPQDELEYWKKRGAQFSQIVSQLQSPEVRPGSAASP